MDRMLAALLLLLAPFAVVISDADAISAGCLPGGFPGTPGPDAVGLDFQFSTFEPQLVRGDIWRVICADDPSQVALLLRLTPQSDHALACGFDFIQGGQQIAAVLRQTPSSTFCGNLLVPTTFSLERSSGPAFDPKGAFTLVYDGGSAGIQRLEVPAGGGFGITIVSTGCNPCNAGQTAIFHVHAVNPGTAIAVELRAGIRFPNNGPTVAIFDLCTETILEAGQHDIPLASIVVPGDIPNGTYIIEAAVLNPVFGITLSRHSLAAVKQ